MNSCTVGPWRSWERASMASRRSWVRIPSAPPKIPVKVKFLECPASFGSLIVFGLEGLFLLPRPARFPVPRPENTPPTAPVGNLGALVGVADAVKIRAEQTELSKVRQLTRTKAARLSQSFRTDSGTARASLNCVGGCSRNIVAFG